MPEPIGKVFTHEEVMSECPRRLEAKSGIEANQWEYLGGQAVGVNGFIERWKTDHLWALVGLGIYHGDRLTIGVITIQDKPFPELPIEEED